MKHSGILLCFALMGTLSGCSLENPPECSAGHEKCIDNVLGRGLYYVCGADGKWNMPAACVSECNGSTCGVFEDSRSCSVEGESQCLSYPEGNVSLVCQNGKWIMGLCNGECKGQKCVRKEANCREGDKRCLYIEDFNLSLESECVDQLWVSRSCGNGVSCDKENSSCEPPPYITCDVSNGKPCQGKDSWLRSTCQDGQCVLSACKDTYILSHGAC